MFKIQFEIKSKMTAYVWAISGYDDPFTFALCAAVVCLYSSGSFNVKQDSCNVCASFSEVICAHCNCMAGLGETCTHTHYSCPETAAIADQFYN